MIFLNRSTYEYPRFPGDVALDPTADWVQVVETEWPPATETHEWLEDFPIEKNGVWYQAWKQIPLRPKPEPEIER